MLTSGFVQTYEIPGEPGQTIDLRLLSWSQLEKARRAALVAAVERMREIGGAEGLGELQKLGSPSQNGQTVVDPLGEYDRLTLLKMGVVRWSYPVEVTPETLGDLDEATARWATRIIAGIETETEHLNDSARSVTR
jgi:hypothetical protein